MRFILTVSSCFENNITKFPGLHSFGQNLIFPDFFDRELHITLRLKLSGRLCVQIHIAKLSIFMSHFLNSGFIYPNNFFSFSLFPSSKHGWLLTTWVTDCTVVFEYAFKLVLGGLTSSVVAAGSSSVLTSILTPSASRSIIPPRCCCRRYKAAICFWSSLNSAVTEKSVAASTSIGGGADHKLSTSQLIDSRQTGHIA